jgi:hypothetical protein
LIISLRKYIIKKTPVIYLKSKAKVGDDKIDGKFQDKKIYKIAT